MENARKISDPIFASADHFVIRVCENQLLKNIESISIKIERKFLQEYYVVIDHNDCREQ
jgi:hypothetical protein